MRKYLLMCALLAVVQSHSAFGQEKGGEVGNPLIKYADIEKEMLEIENRLKNKDLEPDSYIWFPKKESTDPLTKMGELGSQLKENKLKRMTIDKTIDDRMNKLLSKIRSLKEQNKISNKEYEKIEKRWISSSLLQSKKIKELMTYEEAVEEHLHKNYGPKKFAEYLKALKLPSSCSLSVLSSNDENITIQVKNKTRSQQYKLNFVSRVPVHRDRRDAYASISYDLDLHGSKQGTINVTFSDDDIVNLQGYRDSTSLLTRYYRKPIGDLEDSHFINIDQTVEGRVLSFVIGKHQIDDSIPNKIRSKLTTLNDNIVCKEEDPKPLEIIVNDTGRGNVKVPVERIENTSPARNNNVAK